MTLSVREQTTYWGIAALAFLGLLWLLGDILLPFVLGAAFAYLLDPIADRLQRLGLSRTVATVVITLVVLLVVVLALVRQVAGIIAFFGDGMQTLPARIAAFEAWVAARFPAFSFDEAAVRDQLVQLGQALQGYGGQVVGSVVSSALGFVNVVLIVVIVPVVTFYLLLDWDRLVARIDDLLPRDHAPVIRRIAGEIDATLAGFLRGMGTVSLILGTFYALALALLGVPFGLFIGIFAGLVTFIPYVGAVLGGALAIGFALFEFWGDWTRVGLVAAVFVAGQLVEGNILTPKLVGSSIGLHPVWLIFALTAFGTVFGFLGLLVAVPVAAMIGVVTRFFIARYKAGPLYRGGSGAAPPGDGLSGDGLSGDGDRAG